MIFIDGCDFSLFSLIYNDYGSSKHILSFILNIYIYIYLYLHPLDCPNVLTSVLVTVDMKSARCLFINTATKLKIKSWGLSSPIRE